MNYATYSQMFQKTSNIFIYWRRRSGTMIKHMLQNVKNWWLWIKSILVTTFFKLEIIFFILLLQKGTEMEEGWGQMAIYKSLYYFTTQNMGTFLLIFWNPGNKTVKEKNGVWFKECFKEKVTYEEEFAREMNRLDIQAQKTALPKSQKTWSPWCVGESINN